jgi:V/A-type H+/Na+-transporting ATPase subunit E
MKYDHLIQSMEAGAEEKLQEIRDHTNREIEEIRERTGHDALQFSKDLMEETQKKVAVERNKKLYAAREEVKEHIATGREEAFQKVFQKAGTQLSSVRASQAYEAGFSAMLAEIIHGLGDEGISLHIDKRDEELCRRLLKKLGKDIEIIADLTSMGGLNGSTKDGRIIVHNTFEDRLKRAREHMRTNIFLALFGDQDVR